MSKSGITFWDLPVEIHNKILGYLQLMDCMNLLAIPQFKLLMCNRLDTDRIFIVSPNEFLDFANNLSSLGDRSGKSIDKIIFPSEEFNLFSKFMQSNQFPQNSKILYIKGRYAIDDILMIQNLVDYLDKWKQNWKKLKLLIDDKVIIYPVESWDVSRESLRDVTYFVTLSMVLKKCNFELSDSAFVVRLTDSKSAINEHVRMWEENTFKYGDTMLESIRIFSGIFEYPFPRTDALDVIHRFKNIKELILRGKGTFILGESINKTVLYLKSLEKLHLRCLAISNLKLESKSITTLLIENSSPGKVLDLAGLTNLRELKIVNVLDNIEVKNISPKVSILEFCPLVYGIPVIYKERQVLPYVEKMSLETATLACLTEKFGTLFPQVTNLSITCSVVIRDDIKIDLKKYDMEKNLSAVIESLDLTRFNQRTLNLSEYHSLAKLKLFKCFFSWDCLHLPPSLKIIDLVGCEISSKSYSKKALPLSKQIQHLSFVDTQFRFKPFFEEGSLLQTISILNSEIPDIHLLMHNCDNLEVLIDYYNCDKTLLGISIDKRNPIYEKYNLMGKYDCFNNHIELTTQESRDFVVKELYGLESKSTLLVCNILLTESKLRYAASKNLYIPKEILKGAHKARRKNSSKEK